MGKIGCYLCEGCGIGEAVNVGALAETAKRSGGPVRTSKAFCLEDAALIREDVERDNLDAVVIAACSQRVNRDVFRMPNAFVERVNWREAVAWSHPPALDETQNLARDYLEMGIARAERARPPSPSLVPGERTILVVGGGPAGISAATSAARAGFAVVLVEKSDRLGGYATRLYKQYAHRPPFGALPNTTIGAEITALQALRNVTIALRSQVLDISGQPGRFKVRLGSSDGVEAEYTAGAIILATGWKPLEAAAYDRYGLGAIADVVTSDRYEEMARAGSIVRPSDGKKPQRIAFLLCDAEDDASLPYGGVVTSLVALKGATYVRELIPDGTAYVFYRDLHALGLYEYFYRQAQADPSVMLCQGKSFNVHAQSGGALRIEAEGTLLGGNIELEVDLVVLATAMKPELDGDGGVLNLKYLQGNALPTTRFGFADSNFICFPFETQRTGIYTAGSVRTVMDLPGAARDGRSAALKAMQAIEHASTGEAVHPRSGDLTFPEFFIQKCTSCGRCTQECPFGALELNERRQPTLQPNRCRRCGICMGACPVQIISFADYSVDVLSNMIRAVEIPEDEEKPRILVLACENDAYPALDMAGIKRLEFPAAVRVIPVRCLGSVNSILVTDAVSRGFDGVALLGCKPGDDYQCHFIRGSQLLGTRMDNMRETLGRLMLEPERVSVLEVAISDAYKLPSLLAGFVDDVRALGPNPMKGFG